MSITAARGLRRISQALAGRVYRLAACSELTAPVTDNRALGSLASVAATRGAPMARTALAPLDLAPQLLRGFSSQSENDVTVRDSVLVCYQAYPCVVVVAAAAAAVVFFFSLSSFSLSILHIYVLRACR